MLSPDEVIMPDILRPYLSRILAPIIVWFLGTIAARYHVIVTEDQVHAFAELIVALILVGITHKAIDSKINKHDVANIEVAKANKDAGV